MATRYVVRRALGEQGYSIWNNETNKVVVLEDQACVNLGFDEAVKTVDRLNGGGRDKPKEE